jgi:peptide/nickel transport system permease protein
MKPIINTLLAGLFAAWLTFTTAFVLLRLVPTSALEARISLSELNAVEAQRITSEYGLDQSVSAQYLNQLMQYLGGDLGRSLRTGQPVTLLLGTRLRNTLELVGTVSALSVVLSVLLAWAAFQSRAVLALVEASSVISLSAPVYWTGLLALLVVGGWFGLPQSSFLLPVLVLTFHLTAQMSRALVVMLHHAEQMPFVVYGQSKGLPAALLWFRYVLRPSAAAFIALFASQMAILLGSTVTVEALFARPGVGTMLVDAVIARDYPVVQGAVLLLALLSLVVGLGSQMLSQFVDPRVRS